MAEKLNVTEYFNVNSSDFQCHCGCGSQPDGGIDPNLVYLVNCISTVIGEKVLINSAYRCESHNASVGGASQSYHVKGMAADINQPTGWSLDQLYELAVKYGATGIGGYPDSCFIHVDVRKGLTPGTPPIDGETWGSFGSDGASDDANTRLKNAAGGTTNFPSKTTASSSKANTGSNTFGYQTSGNLTIKVKPVGKTYCEPVYPDLLSLPGCIPASVIDVSSAVSNASATTTSMEYAISAQDNSKLSGLDISNYVNMDAINQRQKVYNPETDIYTFKAPSVGQPLNSTDPYPVDLKIEELESHTPRVKEYEISLGKPESNEVTLAKKILKIGDAAEKRIVRLENILSTVMRYCFGMGRRMNINCRYYGGQDHRQKYVCIRCKKDDMIGDGAIVQIDQCLSCTRYEPVLGQTYDILNEVGANLSAIHDTNQSSFIDMKEYTNLTRINKTQTTLNDKTFDATRNKIRDVTDTPFT